MENNGDRALLVRLDERMSGITTELGAIRIFLTEKVMTRESCQLRQHEHDARRHFDRIESAARIAVMLSVAVGIFWAVLKGV